MQRTPPPALGDTFFHHMSELRRQVEQESAHGRALVADIADNPVGTVRLDPDIPCMRVVWRGYATDLQIRYVHEATLALLRRHGIAKILGDNTRLQSLGEDIRRWISGDWIPRAVGAGLRVTAATVPNSVFANEAMRELVATLCVPYEHRFFADLDGACDWLRSYSPEG